MGVMDILAIAAAAMLGGALLAFIVVHGWGVIATIRQERREKQGSQDEDYENW